MKKALVILLAVAMMFCFSATAFAAQFNDIDDCSAAGQDAISKVTALGIVEGYDDGGYHPDEAITRAEFAKMAVISAGLGDAAEDLAGVSPAFSDVKVNEWYTGWINMAASQGYVIGYTNGTYGPNNNISYAEVTTVLMRLLGYSDNLTGPWPINYINQATKLDILDDVQGFSANAAATRENVAIMLADTLDQAMVKWIGDPFNDFYNAEISLLEDSFDGKTITGTVDATDSVEVTDVENMEYQVAVDGTTYTADANTAVAGADINLLPGREVTVIYDKDDYASYIQVDDEIIEVAEAEAATADTKFKLDGKTYTKAAGAVVNAFDSDDTNETGYALINSDDEVVKADTDKALGVTLFGTYELVTDVDTDDDDAYVVTTSNDEIDADADDAIFMKNGARVDATDIEAGDILVKNAAVADIYNVIDNPAIKGVVDSANSSKSRVTIDGVNYKYAADIKEFNADYEEQTTATPFRDLVDDTISVYKDATNAVKFFINDNEPEADNYGILVGVSQSYDSFAEEYTTDAITVVDNTGKTVNLEFADDDTADDFDALNSAKVKKGMVFKYGLDENGDIDSVTEIYKDADWTDPAEPLTVNDNRTVTYNGHAYVIANDAVLFNVEDDFEVSLLTKAELLDGDSIECNPVNAGEKDEIEYLYVSVNDDDEIDFVAVTNFNASASTDYAIVEAINDDDATNSTIKFVNDDTLYDVATATVAGIDEGDLVTYTVSGGEVATIKAVDGLTDGYINSYDGENVKVYAAKDGAYVNSFLAADDCVYVQDDEGTYSYVDEGTALKAKNTIKYKLNGDDELEIVVVVK